MRKSTEAKAASDQDFGVSGFPVTTDGAAADSGDRVRMVTIQNISYV